MRAQALGPTPFQVTELSLQQEEAFPGPGLLSGLPGRASCFWWGRASCEGSLGPSGASGGADRPDGPETSQCLHQLGSRASSGQPLRGRKCYPEGSSREDPSTILSTALNPPQLLFFWRGGGASYGILVPRSGIELMPLAVRAPSPIHWTVREFPQQIL